MDWKERIGSYAKQHFAFGIVAAVLMVVVGVVMIFYPVGSLHALLWLLVIALLVAGIFRIVSYARMPYWIRQGFTLVSGVIDIVCSALLLVAMVSSPDVTDEVFALFIGLMFAFDLLFAGVGMLSGTGVVKRMGGSSGWLVASGILAIIAAILLMAIPWMGTAFLMVALAFALIVGGIGLIASAIDLRRRAKSFQDYIDRNGDAFDPENDPFFRWKMH